MATTTTTKPKNATNNAATPNQTAATATSVLLFVPNLIGYARIVAALTSFVLMIGSNDPRYEYHGHRVVAAVVLYVANFVGDLFDGLLARRLNQCSTLGSVMDMVTDRCGTLGLLFVLSVEYGVVVHLDDTTTGSAERQHQVFMTAAMFRLTFLSLALLDIASHWVQTYSTLLTRQHHKSEQGNAGRHFLVRWFYKYYWFFGYLCVGAEVTYIVLYAQKHLHEVTNNAEWLRQGLNVLLAVCIPACLAKQVVNVAQLTSACVVIANHDAEQINQNKKR